MLRQDRKERGWCLRAESTVSRGSAEGNCLQLGQRAGVRGGKAVENLGQDSSLSAPLCRAGLGLAGALPGPWLPPHVASSASWVLRGAQAESELRAGTKGPSASVASAPEPRRRDWTGLKQPAEQTLQKEVLTPPGLGLFPIPPGPRDAKEAAGWVPSQSALPGEEVEASRDLSSDV